MAIPKMTDREKLEKAGWKFIAVRRGEAGTVTHLYEDPETGKLHSKSTAMEMERSKKFTLGKKKDLTI